MIFSGLSTRKISANIRDNSGATPILIVDEHARVSEVIAQANRTDGFANLFVIMDDDGVVCTSLIPSGNAIRASDVEHVKIEHQDSEIGMLVHAAAMSKNGLNVGVRLQTSGADITDARFAEQLPA